MSEAELNTYKLQLQQVEAALTTDPDNEVRVTLTSEYMVYLFITSYCFQELLTLKGDLEQVLNLTLEMLNDQLGRASGEAASGSGEKAEEDAEAYNKPKKKSRWAEPAPILPIKPWQVGENCQALYSGIFSARTMSVFVS